MRVPEIFLSKDSNGLVSVDKTRVISVAPALLTTSITHSTMDRPMTGCRTFGKVLFIRVPLPAARIRADIVGLALFDDDSVIGCSRHCLADFTCKMDSLVLLLGLVIVFLG